MKVSEATIDFSRMVRSSLDGLARDVDFSAECLDRMVELARLSYAAGGLDAFKKALVVCSNEASQFNAANLADAATGATTCVTKFEGLLRKAEGDVRDLARISATRGS